MRIVAGERGGRRISAPRGAVTRPTSDRVREALFSILGDLGGVEVLDAFAGSGALGLEALSRGAATATFWETSTAALRALRGNIEALGFGDRTTVLFDSVAEMRAATPGLGKLYYGLHGTPFVVGNSDYIHVPWPGGELYLAANTPFGGGSFHSTILALS